MKKIVSILGIILLFNPLIATSYPTGPIFDQIKEKYYIEDPYSGWPEIAVMNSEFSAIANLVNFIGSKEITDYFNNDLCPVLSDLFAHPRSKVYQCAVQEVFEMMAECSATISEENLNQYLYITTNSAYTELFSKETDISYGLMVIAQSAIIGSGAFDQEICNLASRVTQYDFYYIPSQRRGPGGLSSREGALTDINTLSQQFNPLYHSSLNHAWAAKRD
ncbi:MAG: hypothetical protein WDZ28_00270 [Simkaniaceae bacterium]